MDDKPITPNMSIIAVRGNVLDRIGFSIAERANKSAELRLEKTLTTLTSMELKDSNRFRKQKYNMKSQLDRLKMSQLQLKRERLQKSMSVGEGLNLYRGRASTAGTAFPRRRSQGVNVLSTRINNDTDSMIRRGSCDDKPSRDVGFHIGHGLDDSRECSQLHLDNNPGGVLSDQSQRSSSQGTLRRGVTEPDLLSLAMEQSYMLQGRQIKRPLSANALPELPRTPFLVQIGSDVYTQRQRSVMADNPDISGTMTKETSRGLGVPSLTKAHFSCLGKLPPIKPTTGTIPNESVDIAEAPETVVRDVVRVRSPRSYFHKYGIPMDKAELLRLLVDERELLQERVRAFLAKNNP